MMMFVEDPTKKVERQERFTAAPQNNRYLELKAQRPNLIKKYLLEGKIDDPSKKYNLEDARAFDGECMDMCPEFERHEREYQNGLMDFEKIPGTNMVDHSKAVKRYRRSAADDEIPLPCDVRPPHVLTRTLNYLLSLIPQYGLSATYSFIRDRMRAIRKDLTLQNIRGETAIRLFENIARYHILCAHELCETIDIKQEYEQLGKSLQSLIEFYDEQLESNIHSPNEAEFRAYYLLHHALNQSIQSRFEIMFAKYRPQLLNDSKIKLAIELRSMISMLNSDDEPGFIGDDLNDSKKNNNSFSYEAFSRFFYILSKSDTPFLMACSIHPHFIGIRRNALKYLMEVLYVFLNQPNTFTSISQLCNMLGYNDIKDAKIDLEYYELNDNIVNNNFVVLGKVKRKGDGTINPKLGFFEEKRVSLKPRSSIRLISKKIENLSLINIIKGIFPEKYQQTEKVDDTFINLNNYEDGEISSNISRSISIKDLNENTKDFKYHNSNSNNNNTITTTNGNIKNNNSKLDPFASISFGTGFGTTNITNTFNNNNNQAQQSGFSFTANNSSFNNIPNIPKIENQKKLEPKLDNNFITQNNHNTGFTFTSVNNNNNTNSTNEVNKVEFSKPSFNIIENKPIVPTFGDLKQEEIKPSIPIKAGFNFGINNNIPQINDAKPKIKENIQMDYKDSIPKSIIEETSKKEIFKKDNEKQIEKTQKSIKTIQKSNINKIAKDLCKKIGLEIFKEELLKIINKRIMERIKEKLINDIAKEIIEEESIKNIKKINLARKFMLITKQLIQETNHKEKVTKIVSKYNDFSELGTISPNKKYNRNLISLPYNKKRELEKMDIDEDEWINKSFYDRPKLNFVFSMKRLSIPWITELSKSLMLRNPNKKSYEFTIGLLDLSKKNDIDNSIDYNPSVKQIFSLFLQDISDEFDTSYTEYTHNAARHTYYIGDISICITVLLLTKELEFSSKIDSFIITLGSDIPMNELYSLIKKYKHICKNIKNDDIKTSLTIFLPEVTVNRGSINHSLLEGPSWELFEYIFTDFSNEYKTKFFSIFEFPYFIYQQESLQRRNSYINKNDRYLMDILPDSNSGTNINFSHQLIKNIHIWGLKSHELFSKDDPVGQIIVSELRNIWNNNSSNNYIGITLEEFNENLLKSNDLLKNITRTSFKGYKEGILRLENQLLKNKYVSNPFSDLKTQNSLTNNNESNSSLETELWSQTLFEDIMMPLPAFIPDIPLIRFNKRDFDINDHDINKIQSNINAVFLQWIKEVFEQFGWIFSDYMDESTIKDDDELNEIQARILSILKSFYLTHPIFKSNNQDSDLILGFADNLDEEEPLSNTKESILKLIPGWQVAQLIFKVVLFEISWDRSLLRRHSYISLKSADYTPVFSPASSSSSLVNDQTEPKLFTHSVAHRRPKYARGFVYYEV